MCRFLDFARNGNGDFLFIKILSLYLHCQVGGTTLGKSPSIISQQNPFGEIGTPKSFKEKYNQDSPPLTGKG